MANKDQRSDSGVSFSRVAEAIRVFCRDEYKGRYHPKQLVFDDQIGSTRLKNFLKKHAPMEEGERALMFFDTTSFRSGREGLLVTDRGLYAGSEVSIPMQSYYVADHIGWRDVISIDIDGAVIRTNGWEFFSPNKYHDNYGTKTFVAEIIKSVVALPEFAAQIREGTIFSGTPPCLSDADLPSVLSDVDTLYLLHFPVTPDPGSHSMKVARTLYTRNRFGSRFRVRSVLRSAENGATFEAFDVIQIPAFLIVHRGRVLKALIGQSANWEQVGSMVDGFIRKLDEHGLSSQAIGALADETSRSVKASFTAEEWQNAIMSGLVAGVVLAVVRYNKLGVAGFMFLTIVYGLLIKFAGFTFGQGALATALAFLVGYYGLDLVNFVFAR